ncbi:MAG: formate--tetrahydrofolate ligase [Alphaproteobacteria bacterium]
MKSDIEIARSAKMRPISEIAEKYSIPEDALYHFGKNIAKIDYNFIDSLNEKKGGKLILVTAITPTPAGEGKTTTSVGLCDGLNRIGKKTIVCLREPSLGPVFGMKGGAAGGGMAQVVPMENINLHFTGDLHAIGAANNLLAAIIDNHIYWDNEKNIDSRRVTWRRAIDMNDRSLRCTVSSLGGAANGFPRETGFDITVASEVMAIFCLSNNLKDLQQKLGSITIGMTKDKKPVLAKELNAEGAMTALLRDALMPNLVQTMENNPAFIHGGPFANIAHGCNSIIATKTALKLADYVVTEAGFGADLGAEKFFDIKCRKAGLKPEAVVIVATIKALKMHGGIAKDNIHIPNVEAVKKGLPNLGQHLENLAQFKVPAVVAINSFSSDTKEENEAVIDYCQSLNVKAVLCSHWLNGGAGTEDLAQEVVTAIENSKTEFKPLYPDNLSLEEKITTIAQKIYHADGISFDNKTKEQLALFQENGYNNLPVCIAKTQYSFSTDANLKGAPRNFTIPVREVRLSSGAGFVVVICGDIMTMPGLPRIPAANSIFVNDKKQIEGLF